MRLKMSCAVGACTNRPQTPAQHSFCGPWQVGSAQRVSGALAARQCFESFNIAVELPALRARRRHWCADMDAEANKD